MRICVTNLRRRLEEVALAGVLAECAHIDHRLTEKLFIFQRGLAGALHLDRCC